MEFKVTLLAILICISVSYYSYLNLGIRTFYKWHPELLDPETGVKYAPRDLFDILKVIEKDQHYIDSTSAQQRLYDLKYNMEPQNIFRVDHIYSDKHQLKASGGPIVNQTQCGKQLDWILNKLNATGNYLAAIGQTGYELTIYMDSFGRLGTGAYSGVFDWLGSYGHCIKATLDGGAIKTRYCIAKMRPTWWKIERVKTSAYQIGICLPETCDTSSYDLHKDSIQRLIMPSIADVHNQVFEFESMFCLPDERSTIRQIPYSGWLFISLITVWLLMIILSTFIYEYRNQHIQDTQTTDDFVSIDRLEVNKKSAFSSIDEIIETFALRVRLRKFVEPMNIKYAKVNLGFLNVLKVIMTLFIVFGHSGWLLINYARSLSFRIELATMEQAKLLTFIGVRTVETFFLIFGVLRTYTFLGNFNHQLVGNPLIWVRFMSLPMIRVIPTFMLMYWYAKLISPYTGSGPYWDYAVDHRTPVGFCKLSTIWDSIPLFANYTTYCVNTGWFVMVYTKLALVLPALAYVMYKLRPQLVKILFTSVLVGCSVGLTSVNMLQQTVVRDDSISAHGVLLLAMFPNFQDLGYTSAISRLGVVMIGCLFGSWLYQYENSEIKQWPRLFQNTTIRNITFILNILVLLLLPIVGGKLEQWSGNFASLPEVVISDAVLNVLWPLLNSLLVIYLSTCSDKSVVMRFFNHHIWHVINKLGLCILLIHFEIVIFDFTNSEPRPPPETWTEFLMLGAFTWLRSMILATFIHILFEAPMTALLQKLVIGKGDHDTVKHHK